ncbi:diacylglycerol kinase theta-like, partial [Carica papaya]|uniref:diacylglycerol kinase theta-like n=1 Tax=Carica papaya TaxID=3649 RepID=UPI000B8C6E84
HPLTKVYLDSDYICDACNQYGNGTGFLCKPCDFILHDFCATCPETLSPCRHHHHVLTRHLSPSQTDKICDLCSDEIEGLYYNCQPCGFDAHPICTQLSRNAHQNRDPIEAWFAATFGSITAKGWMLAASIAAFSAFMVYVISQGRPGYYPVNYHHHHYYLDQYRQKNQNFGVLLALMFVLSFVLIVGVKLIKGR